MHFDHLNTFHGCMLVLYCDNIQIKWMIVVALVFGLIQVAICYQLFDQFEDQQTEYILKGFEVLIFIMCVSYPSVTTKDVLPSTRKKIWLMQVPSTKKKLSKSLKKIKVATLYWNHQKTF